VLRIPLSGINFTKHQIFQPVDPQTEEGALTAMQVLIKTIYAEEEAAVESDEDIQGLARDACQECISILKEPEKSQAKPATKVLCAFISTTRRPSFCVFLFQF
jgi:DNA repair/transcription protein MET18/MMS19